MYSYPTAGILKQSLTEAIRLGSWTVSRYNPAWDFTFNGFRSVWDLHALYVDFVIPTIELYYIGSLVGEVISSK